MNPQKFMASIYLGDRSIEKIIIDNDNKSVSIQIDRVSRVRGSQWNFYDKEDIVHGNLVFEGAKAFLVQPPGPIPNAWIEFVGVEKEESETNIELYVFKFASASIGDSPAQTEVSIFITATAVYLQDPSVPDVRIVE